MGISRSIDKKEESEGKLEDESQREAWRRDGVQRKTDQSAGQVDTCSPRVGAVDPLGLWEAEKPGACHDVVLTEENTESKTTQSSF